MSDRAQITARQLWGQITTASPGATTPPDAWCTPLILPSGGVIAFDDQHISTLTAAVTFKLPCHNPDPIISPDTTGNSTIIGFQDPFYASIAPLIFTLAATTVISYILAILIFITPRTFFVGGAGGGPGILARRGMIKGAGSSSSIIGVGRRPLLQKIATVTVAISLTIATADTFNVARYQYDLGYMDASELVNNVVGSLEIRIIRVISDTFLWLAQVQTLIRLFPRHKEKVTIKWLGFAMVSFDTIFSILDSFVSETVRTRPRSFQDAIPALNYLFELAISLIYASCVFYYSLSKRRFAFWNAKMKNICLVALLSYGSVLIPVVFFVLDISKPDFAGWGEYIRWVGAAAASVVVWEWVERIESLERDERKDGILGREIFDGDEMLNMTPSEDGGSWNGHDVSAGAGAGGYDRGIRKTFTTGLSSQYKRAKARLPLRKRRRAAPPDGIAPGAEAADAVGPRILPATHLTIPDTVVTPSRSDTGSAASTVYAIRYHHLTSPSPNITDYPIPQEQPAMVELPKTLSRSNSSSTPPEGDKVEIDNLNAPHAQSRQQHQAAALAANIRQHPLWSTVAHPFKRRRAEPPTVVADAQIACGVRRSPIDRNVNFRGRLEAFASAQRDRFWGDGRATQPPLPVTLIPAPVDPGRTWSPNDVREGADGGAQRAAAATAGDGVNDMHQGPGFHDPHNQRHSGAVVVIPAPTQGRTWSPGDPITDTPGAARQPSHGSYTNSSPQTDSSVTLGHTQYIPRGSLTIAEPSVAPGVVYAQQTSPVRSSYVPPAGILPISEDGERSTQTATPRRSGEALTRTAKTSGDPDEAERGRSGEDEAGGDGGRGEPQVSATPQQPPTESSAAAASAVAAAEVAEVGREADADPKPPDRADGRDTGGT